MRNPHTVTARLRDERGFTLLELLVVMLVLGLLAAVGVPSFLLQKDKARDGEAKVAVRTAAMAIETYRTDNDGEYSDATEAHLRDIEPILNDADLAVISAAANEYELQVVSATGNTFRLARLSNGTTNLACDDPGRAGCPLSGTWG